MSLKCNAKTSLQLSPLTTPPCSPLQLASRRRLAANLQAPRGKTRFWREIREQCATSANRDSGYREYLALLCLSYVQFCLPLISSLMSSFV